MMTCQTILANESEFAFLRNAIETFLDLYIVYGVPKRHMGKTIGDSVVDSTLELPSLSEINADFVRDIMTNIQKRIHERVEQGIVFATESEVIHDEYTYVCEQVKNKYLFSNN